mmetsp:Transcript_68443/g.196340  ORF Transcript_68443/g.196340 Transcript_68443/m.196340 type:complete len:340 (-) Transcript_68443:1861-2880(-)
MASAPVLPKASRRTATFAPALRRSFIEPGRLEAVPGGESSGTWPARSISARTSKNRASTLSSTQRFSNLKVLSLTFGAPAPFRANSRAQSEPAAWAICACLAVPPPRQLQGAASMLSWTGTSNTICPSMKMCGPDVDEDEVDEPGDTSAERIASPSLARATASASATVPLEALTSANTACATFSHLALWCCRTAGAASAAASAFLALSKSPCSRSASAPPSAGPSAEAVATAAAWARKPKRASRRVARAASGSWAAAAPALPPLDGPRLESDELTLGKIDSNAACCSAVASPSSSANAAKTRRRVCGCGCGLRAVPLVPAGSNIGERKLLRTAPCNCRT